MHMNDSISLAGGLLSSSAQPECSSREQCSHLAGLPSDITGSWERSHHEKPDPLNILGSRFLSLREVGTDELDQSLPEEWKTNSFSLRSSMVSSNSGTLMDGRLDLGKLLKSTLDSRPSLNEREMQRPNMRFLPEVSFDNETCTFENVNLAFAKEARGLNKSCPIPEIIPPLKPKQGKSCSSPGLQQRTYI